MKGVCSIPKCFKPCIARGLCGTHYDSWKRGKLPIEAPRVNNQNLGNKCSVAQCSQLSHSGGMCKFHYKRSTTDIPLDAPYGNAHGWQHKGYRMVQVGNREVGEHRHLTEQRIGRKLGSKEVVHHKDRDRSNNSPDNLEVLSWSAHSTLHATKGCCVCAGTVGISVSKSLCRRHRDKVRNLQAKLVRGCWRNILIERIQEDGA